MIYRDRLDQAELAQYAAALNGRARAMGRRGRLRPADLRDRILSSGGCCEWCGASVLGAEFELDHILSLKRGGRHQPANLALACPGCNRRKGQKHPTRFAAEIYAETRRKTPLVERALRESGLGPARQLDLLEPPPPPKPLAAILEREFAPVAPYRWADPGEGQGEPILDCD